MSGACQGAPATRIVTDTMTRLVSDTLIRLMPDPRRFLLAALLGVLAGACTPPRPDAAMVARAQAAADAWHASQAQQVLAMTAGSLQTDPFVDPAVRANPWPCARAIVAAGGLLGLGPKPPCYADAILRQRAATITAVPVYVIGR